MTTLEKLEDLIYNGFKETDRKIREHSEKNERKIREHSEENERKIRERSEENERIFRERSEENERIFRERFNETERIFREIGKRFDEQSKQMIRESNERKEQDKERRKELEEHKKEFESFLTEFKGFTRSVALFAENMVNPALQRLMADRGIRLTHVLSRSKGAQNGSRMEWDVLAYGPEHVVAVEVKLRLNTDDVKDTVERLGRFFEVFDRFRGLTLYGAVAGMSIDDGVDRFAYKQGLFVLAQSGDNIQLLNDDKFAPRVFS